LDIIVRGCILDSTFRISFFIIISLALHGLSLPFGFLLPAESFKASPVEIGYVSRSLDSFYPVPETNVSISSAQLRAHRKKIDPSSEVSSVISNTEPQQKDLLPKTTAVVEKAMSAALVDEPDPVVTAGPLLTQDILAPEVIDQPLMPVTVNTPPLSEEDSSQLHNVVIQGENLISQKSSAVRADVDTRRGFKDALPRYDVNPSPRYPRVAKLRGWEGKVIFEAQILKNGHVGRLQVLASSGYKSLDNAARKAIGRWKFKPATSFGVSIDSQVEIPVTFSLKNM